MCALLVGLPDAVVAQVAALCTENVSGQTVDQLAGEPLGHLWYHDGAVNDVLAERFELRDDPVDEATRGRIIEAALGQAAFHDASLERVPVHLACDHVVDSRVEPLQHRRQNVSLQVRRHRQVLIGIDTDRPNVRVGGRVVPSCDEQTKPTSAGCVVDDVSTGGVHRCRLEVGLGRIVEPAEIGHRGQVAHVHACSR